MEAFSWHDKKRKPTSSKVMLLPSQARARNNDSLMPDSFPTKGIAMGKICRLLGVLESTRQLYRNQNSLSFLKSTTIHRTFFVNQTSSTRSTIDLLLSFFLGGFENFSWGGGGGERIPTRRRLLQPSKDYLPGIHTRSILDPSSIQPRSNLDPSSIRPRSNLDPTSIHPRSILDPSSIHSPSILDPASIHPRSILDPSSIHTRSLLV